MKSQALTNTLFWELLPKVKPNSSLTLLCGGDFNEIIYHNENNGDGIKGFAQMKKFIVCKIWEYGI